MHVTPVLVTSIERADGTILYEAPHEQHRAIDPEVADTVTSVLQQGVERGTGTAAQLAGRPVAGKTGTGQGWRNAWFCGYTPQLADRRVDGLPRRSSWRWCRPARRMRVTGGSYPAQIWQRFMAAALAGAPVARVHRAAADDDDDRATRADHADDRRAGRRARRARRLAHRRRRRCSPASASGSRRCGAAGRDAGHRDGHVAAGGDDGRHRRSGHARGRPGGDARRSRAGRDRPSEQDAVVVLRAPGSSTAVERAEPRRPPPPGRVWSQSPEAGTAGAPTGTASMWWSQP